MLKSNSQYLFNLFFLFVLSALSGSVAFGADTVFGGVDGGGGAGVVCGEKVMTLDLFEARNRGLTPALISDNLHEHLRFFGEKYSFHFARDIGNSAPAADSGANFREYSRGELMLREFQDEVLAKFKDIPSETHLELSKDVTLPFLPIGCHFVQLAFYDDRVGKIYRDSKYWEKLEVVDQAALVVHEYIYRLARNTEIYSSDEIRKLVGHFYSDRPLEPLYAPIWNIDRKVSCKAGYVGETEMYKFYGIEEVQEGQKGVAFYFETFKDVFVVTRVRVFLPGINLVKLVDRSEINLTSSASQKMTFKEWDIEFNKNFGDRYFYLRANIRNSDKPKFSMGNCEWDSGNYDL